MSDKPSPDILDRIIRDTEKRNVTRSFLVRSHNRANRIVLATCSSMALGIYLWSLYSISRGRNLDSSFDKLPDYTPGKH
ncbi:hypothetical protein CSKR_202648 [Clonorchis sinensis]|uniref:Cytochrome c oxidase assembly factor 3 n=1 Tax=Clonorchis sinensis TaxID=79923 RepID=A0A8T1M1T1_CLOSI|nr:hypothetical protein CSKR_202648 [Clonorchis sinensis]